MPNSIPHEDLQPGGLPCEQHAQQCGLASDDGEHCDLTCRNGCQSHAGVELEVEDGCGWRDQVMLLRVRLCCNDVMGIRMCLTVLCWDTCAPQITTKNRLSFCSRELGYEGCEDMQLWEQNGVPETWGGLVSLQARWWRKQKQGWRMRVFPVCMWCVNRKQKDARVSGHFVK